VLRHETYHSFGFDLGLFDQIFWNTVHGRPWESTISQGMTQPHAYFGDHFSPIYYAILPIYSLFPQPDTLLIVQTACVALGAVPIYLLARAAFASTALRVLWVGAYFLFLPVAHINLFDFHETALSILPLGLALYFLERNRVLWFLAALGVAFLVKEEMALIGLGFGAYIVLAKRNWRLGVLVAAGSLATFLAVLYAVIPAFSGGRGFAYFPSRYGELGNSPLAMLRTMVTRPGAVVHTLARPKKGAFLIALFGPVLGLPIWSGWGVLLLLPTLSYLLLSNYEPQYSFTTQYSAPLIPLILGTAILGLSRLPPRSWRLLAGGVLVSSIAFSYYYGDLPFSRRFDVAQFVTESRYVDFAPALSRIPPDASVAAENDLTPHLSHRRYIYALEFENASGADYVALDFAATNRDLTAFNRQVDSFTSQGYQLVATHTGLALLKRSSP
jgi:uncharacterized membrane protein